MIFLFLVFSALVSNSLCRFVCPSGWELYRPERTCLIFQSTPDIYFEAEKTCLRMRGNHAKITSLRKDDFITDLMGEDMESDLWINIRDTNDGRPQVEDYHPWFENNTRPNPDPTASCWVRVFNESGSYWTNEICRDKKSFVCEKFASDVTFHCEDGWELNPSEDACIKAFRKKKKFRGARNFCRRMDGDLATKVVSRRQRVHAQGKRKTQGHHWIGVHSPSEDGKFVHIDDVPVRASPPFKGGRGYPDTEHHCVALLGRRWYDMDCKRKLPFLCEKDPIMETEQP